jgi:hypothetical protein
MFSSDVVDGFEKLIFIYTFSSITRDVRQQHYNHWVQRRANLLIFIYVSKSERLNLILEEEGEKNRIIYSKTTGC